MVNTCCNVCSYATLSFFFSDVFFRHFFFIFQGWIPCCWNSLRLISSVKITVSTVKCLQRYTLCSCDMRPDILSNVNISTSMRVNLASFRCWEVVDLFDYFWKSDPTENLDLHISGKDSRFPFGSSEVSFLSDLSFRLRMKKIRKKARMNFSRLIMAATIN